MESGSFNDISNVDMWVDVQPPSVKAHQRPTCVCVDHCGEDCLNRLLQCECDPLSCPFDKEDCGNRAMQKIAKDISAGKLYAQGYEVVEVGKRGYGLRATRSYAPGELIIEYTGDVISQSEMQRRLNEEYRGIKVGSLAR
jgi:histone-lysine N-methyltransferase ASH1L